MKFDFVIGNPPYQESDGGAGASARPVYNFFVDVAKELAPDAICMITPSRWFAGGKGLDSFRESMLSDRQLIKIVDYVNAKDCFPNTSIGGGVNYFVWKRNANADCIFTNVHDGKESVSLRRLDEYPIFVRYNEAISIIHKIQRFNEGNITEYIFPRNPFGFSSKTRGVAVRSDIDNVKLYSSKGESYLSENKVNINCDLMKKYKVMISKVTSEHAGEPSKDGKFRVISTNKVIRPYEICTDSYLIIFSSDSLEEVNNYKSYLETKFYRFLLLMAVSSINLSKDKFYFIPKQDFSHSWDDKQLFKKYGLSKDEIDFIMSLLKDVVV